MKKALALAAMMVAASVSTANAAAMSKQIELGLGGGIGLATNAGYDLGFGGSAYGLYRCDETLGIGLGAGFHTFSITGLTGASTGSLEIQALLKATLPGQGANPYFVVGAGMSDIIASTPAITIGPFTIPASSASSFYPMVSGGLGVQFSAGADMNVFLQATADLVFGTGSTFTYIPVDLGLNFDI